MNLRHRYISHWLVPIRKFERNSKGQFVGRMSYVGLDHRDLVKFSLETAVTTTIIIIQDFIEI